MTTHRHRWQPGKIIPGQTGHRYVWARCTCGLRRVETQGPGGVVVGRRYVDAQR